MEEVIRRADVQEAIYLASPVLYDEIQHWLKGELKDKKEITKVIHSTYKYLSRMCSRCTPYGLFASCSTGSWGEKSEILLADKPGRHTRLDMNFVCALAQHLAKHPSIKSKLLFYPNNS